MKFNVIILKFFLFIYGIDIISLSLPFDNEHCFNSFSKSLFFDINCICWYEFPSFNSPWIPSIFVLISFNSNVWYLIIFSVDIDICFISDNGVIKLYKQ